MTKSADRFSAIALKRRLAGLALNSLPAQQQFNYQGQRRFTYIYHNRNSRRYLRKRLSTVFHPNHKPQLSLYQGRAQSDRPTILHQKIQVPDNMRDHHFLPLADLLSLGMIDKPSYWSGCRPSQQALRALSIQPNALRNIHYLRRSL